MMRFDGDRCFAELRGRYAIYLDTDSLVELAKGPAPRRERLLSALGRRGTLLFSLTSAVEVGGLQGGSAAAATSFLSAIGPHWVPLEMSPWPVMERERAGAVDVGPVSEWFMKAFVQQRMKDLSRTAGILDLSAGSFFDLGAVVAWSQTEREGIRAEQDAMDHAVKEAVGRFRASYDAEPASLDRLLPPIPFHPRARTTFVLTHLLRTLVLEAKSHQLKRNDALDFCHAVLATAYGSLATLDKAWKRRVGTLPQPCRVARVFYRPELEQLVSMLEALVALEPTD
jgi:hypothetical protein